MKALIDSDSIVYSAGFASETRIYVAEEDGFIVAESLDKKRLIEEFPEARIDHYVEPQEETIALFNVDAMVERILESLGKHVAVDSYQLYLTGKGNFRENLATIQPYKGNRVAARPVHFDAIRQHLVKKWGAIVVGGMEADDRVSIEAWRDLENSIVVSIDKDLNQIPSNHYSWGTHNKEERYWFQTEEEAARSYWTQVLTGDTGDNIPGLPGIGPKRAEKILADCKSESEMQEAVKKTYLERGFDLERLNEVCELLYLLKHENDKWKRVS